MLLSVFMLSYIFVIMCGDFEWKQIYESFSLLVNTCICFVAGYPIVIWGWYRSNKFSPAQFVSVASPGFLTSCWFLSLNTMRWEMIIRYVDIDGIVDHPSVCLNFLLIKSLRWTLVAYLVSCFYDSSCNRVTSTIVSKHYNTVQRPKNDYHH